MANPIARKHLPHWVLCQVDPCKVNRAVAAQLFTNKALHRKYLDRIGIAVFLAFIIPEDDIVAVAADLGAT